VLPPAVEVRLAGSLAKGTNLAGNNEFDIFLLFPRHYSHIEMSMLGITYARRAFSGMKTESRYAEHPYLQVFSGEHHADIVPAYKIRDISEKGSSVDRSQLHTEYVNSKLDARGKRDVRLLKRFMKNFGIYGAEVRVEGFSGYLCELLVIKYGSLFSLMEETSHWKKPAIDIEGHHHGSALREIFDSPLVVFDPVDRERNVAAVVSSTSLSRFIFECRRFIANPSEKFFFSEKRRRSAAEIKKAIRERGTACFLLTFPAPKAIPDVLWPQLKKTANAVSGRLSELDFPVFGRYYWSDGNECAMFFELGARRLPDVRKAVGPSVEIAKGVESFVESHKGALNLHIEHDRIVAVEKREITDAKSALLKTCARLEGSGIPEGMKAHVAKARALEGAAMVKKQYVEFLGDYFFARIG